MSKIDPLINGKDCSDFECLNDGTRTGDPKYCHLSRLCKQLDYKSDYLYFRNSKNEEDFDYFCTGIKITEETQHIDEEVN